MKPMYTYTATHIHIYVHIWKHICGHDIYFLLWFNFHGGKLNYPQMYNETRLCVRESLLAWVDGD